MLTCLKPISECLHVYRVAISEMGLVLLLDIILRALWTLFIVPVAIPAQVIWLYMMRPLLVICPALFWWIEGHITRYLHACMATMVMFAGYSGTFISRF